MAGSSLRSRRSGSLHIHGHGLNHAGVDLIELLDLLRHLACLVIDLVDRANLLAGTFELHLIDFADTGERAVEILHLLAVARQSLALLIDLLQRLDQCLEFFDIVALGLVERLGFFLAHLRYEVRLRLSCRGLSRSLQRLRSLDGGQRLSHGLRRCCRL